MVNAIILAGEGTDSPVKDVSNKALIKIKGKYMVQYIIESLKLAKCVDKVVLIGPEILEKIIGNSVDTVLDSETSIVNNIMKCIDCLGEDKHIIVCTSDIPMVSNEAIEDFVKKCSDLNVDIGYPIIEKSLNEAKFPGAKRTYVKLKDGTYTGGNILYINPSVMKKCYDMAGYLVENRKNVMKMGKIFGISIFLKLSLGILRIKNVEDRVNKVLGINARAVMTPYPEIGNDVDKIDDVDFVIKYINIGA